MSADRDTVLDMSQALKWVEMFAPNCDIHITGGEPFVLPDMVESVLSFTNAGHRTSVLTNASLLSKNPEAYNLPVAWQITHHENQISLDDFLMNIAPLRGMPVVVCKVLGIKEVPVPGIENLYSGFDFRWIRDRGGFLDYDLNREYSPCPNDEMLFVGIYGEIFSCSTDNQQYGSIYDMTFDEKASLEYRCPSGYPDGCQACQTIDILREMHER